MTLEETAELMLSSNYKERFLAEFWQVKIRFERLYDMLVKYENDELDFEPDSDIGTLTNQCMAMDQYLNTLYQRAEMENIELGENE